MSTDTRVRITAFTLAAAAIARSLETMRDLVADLSDVERWEIGSASEGRLEALLTATRASGEPVGAALEELLANSPVLERVSANVAGDARAAAREALSVARRLAQAGQEDAAAAAFGRAESELLRAISSAREVLAPVEAEAARQVIGRSLTRLGYDDIRSSRRGDLRARRSSDGKLVYVRAGSKGGLEIGLAGHDGVTCRAHLSEILQGLRDDGVEMTIPELDYHGNRDGGPVAAAVENAAKAPAPPLGSSADTATRSAAATRPSSRTARLQPVGKE